MIAIAMHVKVYLKVDAGLSNLWEFADVDKVTHNEKRQMFIIEKNSQIIAMIPRENVVMVVYDYDNVPDIGDELKTLPIHEEDKEDTDDETEN